MEKKISGTLQETQLDCSRLEPGVFLLSVQTDKESLSVRFIKE
jgi:hypothetical protein